MFSQRNAVLKRLYVSVRLSGHHSDKIALGGLRFYLICNVRTVYFWKILKMCSQVKLYKLIENNKQVMSSLVLVRLVRSQSRYDSCQTWPKLPSGKQIILKPCAVGFVFFTSARQSLTIT